MTAMNQPNIVQYIALFSVVYDWIYEEKMVVVVGGSRATLSGMAAVVLSSPSPHRRIRTGFVSRIMIRWNRVTSGRWEGSNLNICFPRIYSL